jgi:hypothetical protein
VYAKLFRVSAIDLAVSRVSNGRAENVVNVRGDIVCADVHGVV